ncbi:acid phosphatase 1 [Aristolochia californica]|uniref:acid phosphatase 1 n=1 Tax=Aristolochia californica TaxID=171875 RepID=UPI0035E2D4A4
MERNPWLLFGILCLLVGSEASDWNIMNRSGKKKLGYNLKNYCESWRMNVEINNLRDFEVVPGECADYIGKYMTSTQYKVDVERAFEACILYLSTNFEFNGDGKDAWVFDIDDTLLSTTPYYKKHQFGGEKVNRSALEGWMKESNAPAVVHAVDLYNEIKNRGLKIFLISSRGESLRAATIENLVKVGYTGWTGLIMRGLEDVEKGAQQFMAEQRKILMKGGYRIWGVVGDQWSSLLGLPTGKRTFKLPNSLYYIA